MSRQAMTALTTALNACAKVGAVVPKSVTDQQRQLAALTEKVREYQGASRLGLAEAFLDALATSNDPTTDPVVQAAVTAHTLNGYPVGIEHALDRRAHQFVDNNAPALVAALVKPFEKAADTIGAALTELGDVDLDDSTTILAQGGNAARVWTDARDANADIRHIYQAWAVLGVVTTSIPFESRHRLLVIADVPADRFLDDDLPNRQLTAWEAARRGYPLSLATPETYPLRVAGVHAEQQAQAQARSNDVRQAFQRHRGIAVTA